MKCLKAFLLFLALSFPFFSSANSLRFYNDSPFKLSATILGADGTLLGQMIIYPTKYAYWSDSYNSADTFSYTPYTIIWQCDDGSEYGIWTQVSQGATVTAQGSEGARICKPQKQKLPSPMTPANRGGGLYPPSGAYANP